MFLVDLLFAFVMKGIFTLVFAVGFCRPGHGQVLWPSFR